MAFVETLRTLLTTPTAPYKEQWMLEALGELLATIPGIEVRRDHWGNVAARLRRGHSHAPIAFVAHLDHPGFLITGPAEGGRLPVVFEGGVRSEYFPGTRVRLFRSRADAGIPAVIEEMSERLPAPERNRRGWVRPEADATGAVLGMWDLEAMREDAGIIHGRAIDDLGGVACIIEALRRLAARHEPVDYIALFTRAEECGFRGTIALCMDEHRGDLLPNNAHVVSIETSSQRPHVPVGGGAVLRIGDLQTVFDSELCRTFGEVTNELAQRDGRRPLVRALMDGGSCEASAFNLFGYRSAGMCLPLGHYHNMDQAAQRIAPEFIALADAEDLIATMVEVSLVDRSGSKGLGKLRAEYEALGREGMPKLRA
jgi:endoglucanase